MPKPALITFGPYNGRPISELPDEYLYQLIHRRLWPETSAAVDAELERRGEAKRGADRAGESRIAARRLLGRAA